MKTSFFLFFCLLLSIPAYGQFNSVRMDRSTIEILGDTSTTEYPDSLCQDTINYGSILDSIRISLLKGCANVSLPLTNIRVISNWGFRLDPFSAIIKFHDGIDLSSHYEMVYSMFPGIIIDIQHRRDGYGNSIIVAHGNIQCLYGHLSSIFVHVGQSVPAGFIIGQTGNSGRSTGPHLHLKITRAGYSINPLPFLLYLSDYITSIRTMYHSIQPSPLARL